MSFSGLDDGIVESIPTLIDEDLDLESLFAGEDLFEFLDERVPGTLVIPPAPVVAAAPVVAPNPVVESREPSGYTAPVFFPFGRPEPTPPQLKISGVSSFKKINSRLLQGGALNEREEADAIRELERALGVLGHQKRFLREHKAGLEKWASAVYGFNLSTAELATEGAVATVMGDGENRGRRELLHEVRVTVKCKGSKRRVDNQPLLAHVAQTWSPRHGHCKNVKRRSYIKTEAEKPAKRGKVPISKAGQAVVVGTSSTFASTGGTVEDGLIDEQSDGKPGTLATSHQVSDGCIVAPPISRGQPLPGGLDLGAKDRTGAGSICPSTLAGQASKTATEPGVGRDRLEDDADVLRQRLVQALVVSPGIQATGHESKGQPQAYAEATWRKPPNTDALDRLDVAQLNLEQRVLVQLNCVGVFAVDGQMSL